MYVERDATFEATTVPGAFDTGKVGTLGVRILDNEGSTSVARTTAGITEFGTSTIYTKANFVAPTVLGQYTIAWDDGLGNWATEDLVVVAVGSPLGPSPPPGPPVNPGAGSGSGTNWVDSEYVWDVCSDQAESTDWAIFDPWITIASDLLFRLSGRQFPGTSEHTVRPCGDGGICAGWAWPLTHREADWYVAWSGAGWNWSDGGALAGCGCYHVPRVHLPDYPVTAITEVTIDGVVVSPSTYALREFKYLDRLDGEVWPSCQDMRVPLGDEGTWGVTYTWGSPIPALGVHAAAVLACELYTGSIGGECNLPEGVTSLTRQGVSMSSKLFAVWGIQNGQWATGLSAVDAFLQAVNPHGLMMPSTVWSPDLEQFPRPDYA